MTTTDADPSPTLPIWRGRRGYVALAVIGVMASGCGIGVMQFAERGAVEPTCRHYAQAQGWRYMSLFTYADSTISSG